MLEKQIEERLCRLVKTLGGMCEKFTSPQKRSVPDRIVTVPGGTVVFVECKAPGKTPTELQARDHKRRKRLGCKVFVVDSYASVDQLILTLKANMPTEDIISC